MQALSEVPEAIPHLDPTVPRESEPFYITGGTLPGTAACYVERAADAELLNGILTGEYVYVLDARQMGKSSLCIRTLAKLKAVGIRTAFVDLTKFGVRNITPEQWFIAMLREVGRELGIARQLAAYWKEAAEVAPVQRFFGALQDCALSVLLDRIAIFIDEIDVTRSLPFDTDEFFAGIRQCYIGRANHPDLARLTFSLIGTATPAELIEDTRVSPFNIGRRVELDDFQFLEARILARSLPDGETSLRRILYWTDGHPYLTQRLCQLASKPETGGVDAACQSLFFRRDSAETDDNLAFVRNRLLRNDQDISALLELFGKVRAGTPILYDETNPLCAVLRLSGIARVEAGKLRVRNRIYKRVFDGRWIRAHLPDAERRRQRSAFRKGVLRTSAIAVLGVAIVAGLAAYGFQQAVIARQALASSKRLTANLQQSDASLRAALDQTRTAFGLAEARRIAAEDAKRKAHELAMLESSERTRADRSAIRAGRAEHESEEVLARSLIDDGVRLLNANDPASAIEPLRAAIQIPASTPEERRIARMRLNYAYASSNTLLQVWSGKDRMIDAEFLDGGRRILTANADGTLRVWDSLTGRPLSPPMKQSGMTSCVVARDGRHALTGNALGEVKWWDLGRAAVVASARGLAGVQRLALSQDGKIAAIAYSPRNMPRAQLQVDLCTWPTEGKLAPKMFDSDPGPAGVETMVFAPGGKRLFVGCGNWVGVSYDLGDGFGTHPIPNCYSCFEGAFLEGGRFLLVNGVDRNSSVGYLSGQVAEFDRNGRERMRFISPSPQDGFGRRFKVSPDGKSIVVATAGGMLDRFDLATGKSEGVRVQTGLDIFDCDLSRDGTLAAVSEADGSVRVWNLLTGKLDAPVCWHGAVAIHARLDPTGTRLLSCGNDGTARLWRLHPQGLVQHEFTNLVTSWTRANQLIAQGSRGVMRWESGTHFRLVLPGWTLYFQEGPEKVCSRRIVERKGMLRVYDFDRSRFLTPPLTLPPSLRPEEVFKGISDDERFFFWQSSPKTLEIDDISGESAKLLHRLALGYRAMPLNRSFLLGKGHSRVSGCAVLPSKNRILTTGADGQIDLWDYATGRRLARIQGPAPDLEYQVSPNGEVLIAKSGLADGRYRFRTYSMQSGRALGLDLKIGYRDLFCWFNQDGSRVILWSWLWDTRTGRRIPLGRDTSGPFSKTPSNGSIYFLNARGTEVLESRSSQIYSASTGKALSGRLNLSPFAHGGMSADGKRFVFSTEVDATVIDSLPSPTVRKPFRAGGEGPVGFTPDSELVWTVSSNLLRLWDPLTGEQVLPPIPGGQYPPLFSPNGKSFFQTIGSRVLLTQLPDGTRVNESGLSQSSQRTMNQATFQQWRKSRGDRPWSP